MFYAIFPYLILVMGIIMLALSIFFLREKREAKRQSEGKAKVSAVLFEKGEYSSARGYKNEYIDLEEEVISNNLFFITFLFAGVILVGGYIVVSFII